MPTFEGMPSQPDAAAKRLAQLTAELEAIRAAEGLAVAEPGGPIGASAPVSKPVPGPSVARAGHETPPGRHASRRLCGLMPEGLRGRIAIGPAQIAVVSVVVAVGVALTAWWLVRANGEEIEPLPVSTSLTSPAEAGPTSSVAAVAPAATAASPATDGTEATGNGATGEGAEVVVDVAGKVRRPGIVVLPPGSRVVDAVDQAGGPRRGVSLTALNLARPLVDGEQILVGIRPVPGLAASAASSPGASVTPGGLVNINTADAVQLEELPEVGPVTAAAIIAWRTDNGGFTSVEELLDVDGIGEVTLAKIAPHVTL